MTHEQTKVPGGDPVEVARQTSRAESQAGLNGPSGSPTSPPGPVRRIQPALEISEKEWQRDVTDLARMLGWDRIYHTFDSRRSQHGFPDLVLVRERVCYLELKSERGRLSDAQKGWLRALLDANAEAYVVRPSQLELLAAVLTARQHRSLELTHATWAELS